MATSPDVLRGRRRSSFLERLGLPEAINASGIYTDLGGSRLEPAVWRVAEEMNFTWASMPEMLDRSGALLAEMTGAEAARIVPGVSAGLALAVGATIAGLDHQLIESLPQVSTPKRNMVLQRGHRYKYVRCALMSGAELREVGDQTGTERADLQAELTEETACVLHPAHLDGQGGTLELDHVAEMARSAGVPVVVDAAYMSFPPELIGSYTARGAAAACFSAKYFWGPNCGGFILGDKELIDAVRALDFTWFESGPHLTFGRAFKMDRLHIAATVVALERWLSLDHKARFDSYRERADALSSDLAQLPLVARGCSFTLDERVVDEPVNSLLVAPRTIETKDLAAALAEGNPSIRAVPMPEGLVFCLETVEPSDDDLIAQRLRELLG